MTIRTSFSFCLMGSLVINQVAYAADAFSLFEEEARVITASHQPTAQSQSPATVYIVTAEDIKASGALNIWDALRSVPGVDVMASRTTQGDVSIRGLNQPLNNRTLILLDGRSVLNPFYDFMNWERLPISFDEIDRIEVVEGPASAIHGANAMNGVINIITRTPEQINGGRLSYVGGERNTQIGSAVYGRQVDRLGYRLGGGWRSINRFENADRKSAQSEKFNAALNYRISDQTNWNSSAGVTHLDTLLNTGSSGIFPETGHAGFARTDLRHRSTNVRAYWNFGRTTLESLSSTPLDLDYDTYDVSLDRSFILFRTHRLVTGANYRINTGRSNTLGSGSASQDLWTVFFEDTWEMNEKWSLVGSARLDHHPLTSESFSPRGSLLYHPVPNQTFRVSAGTAFRNPTLTENYAYVAAAYPNSGLDIPNPPYSTIQYLLLGNRWLNPEKAKMVELSHTGRFGRWKTNVTGFHYEIENMIRFGPDNVVSITPPNFSLESSFINSGKNNVLGGEAGVDVAVTPRLTLFTNYSYQYIQSDAAATPSGRQSPRHKANSGFRVKRSGFTANLWAHWVDKTYWPVLPNPSAATEFLPVESYFLMNARVSYAWRGRWDGLEIGINAFNLLNDDHYELLPANGNMQRQNGEIIRGRWSGTLSYRF